MMQNRRGTRERAPGSLPENRSANLCAGGCCHGLWWFLFSLSLRRLGLFAFAADLNSALERRAIFRALRETSGDKLAAARLLGIGKTTLYRKLKQYESEPPRLNA